MPRKIKVGVLGSTRGTDLLAIFEAIDKNELYAEISVVISNRKNALILDKAKMWNVPFFHVSHKEKTREVFDSEVTEILEQHGVDLVLLIGFMRILSEQFCNQWNMRILNVHPSLLPKYAGGMDTNVHEEVLKNGEKETGCTVHYVSKDVDQGEILVQKTCPVLINDSVDALKERVQNLEGLALIEAINKMQKILC